MAVVLNRIQMRYIYSSLLALCAAIPQTRAQFAPQAGISGTEAIHKSDLSIKSWATNCVLYRGLQDIAVPSLGYPALGDSVDATGAADGSVVCMGDSGVAVMTFAYPIYNGSGNDFAIFENGFANPANKEEAFLELAFVEVSSDGEHFVRFPAVSNTPNAVQVKGAGEYMNARYIDNLAGKYIAQYGTPFDLEDIKGISGVDINHITHVRIIDVIGDIGLHNSKDSKGNIINDPYPTAFPTGGFDLDAVAVINQKSTGISDEALNAAITVFPNPATDRITIAWQQLPANERYTATLFDLSGRQVASTVLNAVTGIDLTPLQKGLYYLSISNTSGTLWAGKISKI